MGEKKGRDALRQKQQVTKKIQGMLAHIFETLNTVIQFFIISSNIQTPIYLFIYIIYLTYIIY